MAPAEDRETANRPGPNRRPAVAEPMPWMHDDGGRWPAGYRGEARDCVTRAIALATGLPYQEVYDLMNEHAERERPRRQRNGKTRARSSARTGVSKPTTRAVMAALGWAWQPVMGIGTGCTVHLAQGELPAGRLVVQLSGHVTAVIDGTIYDTHDPRRDGTRCVYGFWYKPGPAKE